MLLVALAGGFFLSLCDDGRREFVEANRVQGNSMAPTIQGVHRLPDGTRTSWDGVINDKSAYWFHGPRRGDIVLFRSRDIPALASMKPRADYWVKRVVGLPGERVSLQPPYVCINGQRVTDPPIFATMARKENGYSGYVFMQDYPGRQYLVSEADSVQLGADEYFVLGDNSAASWDSRCWGPVHRRSIIARVTKIIWPLNRMGIVPE